jgi:hypothetical protein
VGTRCADYATPLYQQKFALTSPTRGERSVGIVLFQTKSNRVCFCFICLRWYLYKQNSWTVFLKMLAFIFHSIKPFYSSAGIHLDSIPGIIISMVF